MNANRAPTGFDWAANRGETWRAHLEGMEATLAPIDGPLLDALRLDAPVRVADVACGGGGTTFELARQAPAGSLVHGVDISPALIETARGRSPREGNAVVFTAADVAKAPPLGGRYDRLASRFGVMFFDDPPAAFANLANWLGPDGRFAFAVWGPPAENPWVTTVREVISTLVELPPPMPLPLWPSQCAARAARGRGLRRPSHEHVARRSRARRWAVRLRRIRLCARRLLDRGTRRQSRRRHARRRPSCLDRAIRAPPSRRRRSTGRQRSSRHRRALEAEAYEPLTARAAGRRLRPSAAPWAAERAALDASTAPKYGRRGQSQVRKRPQTRAGPGGRARRGRALAEGEHGGTLSGARG